MTVFTEIFKRVQLFFFAFTLAASSMMFVGMASGKLDRGVVYMGLAEKFATFFCVQPHDDEDDCQRKPDVSP